MMPTALSQIFEQIVNAVVSVWAAYAFVTSSPSLSQTASRGAAGGTVGTLAGAATALLLLVVVYALYRPTVMRQIRRDRTEVEESGGQVFRILLLTILPVILSQTVYQLGNTADDLIFGNIMQAKGMAATAVSSLQGVFNSQYVLLINVPVAIASAMAASVIPSIVASQTLGDHREVCRKADSVIKFNTVIVLPCAVGLAVLARPIITLLFPSLVTYRDLAVRLLEVGSSAAVFYVLSTITSAILQGLGFMRTPVKHSAIALAIHLVPVSYTHLDVYKRQVPDPVHHRPLHPDLDPHPLRVERAADVHCAEQNQCPAAGTGLSRQVGDDHLPGDLLHLLCLCRARRDRPVLDRGQPARHCGHVHLQPGLQPPQVHRLRKPLRQAQAHQRGEGRYAPRCV